MSTEDLPGLVPAAGEAAFDVGARDGQFSAFLAERPLGVGAPDLESRDFQICGNEIGQPIRPAPVRRRAMRLAVTTDNVQRRFTPVRPNGIHVLFRRP